MKLTALNLIITNQEMMYYEVIIDHYMCKNSISWTVNTIQGKKYNMCRLIPCLFEIYFIYILYY